MIVMTIFFAIIIIALVTFGIWAGGKSGKF